MRADARPSGRYDRAILRIDANEAASERTLAGSADAKGAPHLLQAFTADEADL